MGRPVLVGSHTAEDYKGHLPRFWHVEKDRYRPTPAGLGTYGINYPPHYKLRERAISLGNVTENLVQVLHVHCICTACALRVHCVCTACALRVHCTCTARALHVHCICTASAVHSALHLPCRLPLGSSPLSPTPTRLPASTLRDTRYARAT
eukprot:scaffold69309_cov65-Phaeocystis_antarctica.AAC.6